MNPTATTPAVNPITASARPRRRQEAASGAFAAERIADIFFVILLAAPFLMFATPAFMPGAAVAEGPATQETAVAAVAAPAAVMVTSIAAPAAGAETAAPAAR